MKSLSFTSGAIFCLLILSVGIIRAQSQPKKSSQAITSVALDRMNVLYIGVDNPVTIASTAGRVNATLSPEFGSLIKQEGGSYIARVNTITDECWINVSVNGAVVGRSIFRVRTIPTPQAYVGGYASGSNPPVGAFRAQVGVGAGVKDFAFDLKYTVVSFTFNIDTDDGDILSIPVQGPLFNAQAQNAINRYVRPGVLVTIDNIRVLGPDGRTRTVPSLIYYIQ